MRRQFREKPGIMERTERPEYGTCVDIVTRSALRQMMRAGRDPGRGPGDRRPDLVAQALGGLLMGTIVTGLFLAIAMTSGGGAWDNAKKLIEDGALRRQGLRSPTRPPSPATRSAIPTRTPPARPSTR